MTPGRPDGPPGGQHATATMPSLTEGELRAPQPRGTQELPDVQELPPLPPPVPPRVAVSHLSSLWLFVWLCVAAAAPVMVALLGVCARYLQVTTDPPFPPLMFTSVLNLLALPTLLLFYSLPHLLLRWHLRRRLRQRSGRSLNVEEGGEPALPVEDGTKDDGSSAAGGEDASTKVDGSAAVSPPPPAAAGGAGAARQAAGSQAAAAPAIIHTPQVPSLPGLARLHRRSPKWHRTAVLLVLALCYEAAILGQNVAPGLVDPAVVMLVSMFTVVVVALLARLWLKAPLWWAAVVPTAVVMLAGAGMLLGPDIQAGAGDAGSLTTGRAWLGFAASVGAMLGNACFIVLAQAYRDTNITAIEVQYTIIWMNVLVVLPVSLGVDGTNWGAQFGGMDGQDWAALIFCACVAHAWIAIMIQESTIRLGGLTVSMFFGLRLIASVLASKVILGVTIVQTEVQIAGIVLVAAALAAYTGAQWWAASQQRGKKQAASGVEPEPDQPHRLD